MRQYLVAIDFDAEVFRIFALLSFGNFAHVGGIWGRDDVMW